MRINSSVFGNQTFNFFIEDVIVTGSAFSITTIFPFIFSLKFLIKLSLNKTTFVVTKFVLFSFSKLINKSLGDVIISGSFIFVKVKLFFI